MRLLLILLVLLITPPAWGMMSLSQAVAHYGLSERQIKIRQAFYDDWLASQPSLPQLIESAYIKFDLRFSSLETQAKKARQSALLPKVLTSYDINFDHKNTLVVEDNVNVSTDIITIGPTTGKANYNVNQGQSVAVKMQWDLAPLLYHHDQVFLERQRHTIIETRLKLAEQISKIYQKWQEVAFLAFFTPSVIEHSAFESERRALEQHLSSLSGYSFEH